ncbi:Protein phosphatase 1L [Podila epigama]|nr:Protein phosphatase 1L [Podila epigama]
MAPPEKKQRKQSTRRKATIAPDTVVANESARPEEDAAIAATVTASASASASATASVEVPSSAPSSAPSTPAAPANEGNSDLIFERRNERPLVQPLLKLQTFPRTHPLPNLERFNLTPEQLRHPLFVAIAKTLLVNGNAWQSALDLVGRTPKGSVQGAISTALTLAHSLNRFEPIEKDRFANITYYRMAAQALEPNQNAVSGETQSNQEQQTTAPTRRIQASMKRKKKPEPRWDLDSTSSDDSLSSASSDEEVDHRVKRSNNRSTKSSHTNSRTNSRYADYSGPKRTRASSSSSSGSSSSTSPVQNDTIPNGLKKLPKGYVYDTEIYQNSLMRLSVNPSQTGEYMEHLKGKSERENDFPDRRGQFELDLEQAPSVFGVEQQTGYAYPRLRNSSRCRLRKEVCEDGFAITDLTHNGKFLGRLFCITDGHGGCACSNYVIATVPGAMQVILGRYKATDFALPSVQEIVKRQITDALRVIDKEYLEYKKRQYMLFKAKAIPSDPGSDGTTLIVNIFIDKWIINVNLGDSRSMISSRDFTGRWNVDYFSEDHTPSLERLAHTIYANGGEFVTHDDKIIKFDPNLKSDKKHRQSLKEARIRVRDAALNEYGIPWRTRNGQCASVNLGACIGDILYKLDPVNPVLSCTPDVTFIDISEIQQGYMLMASDGLWDYVNRGGKVQDQNALVSQFIGDKLDRGWSNQRIVSHLSDREGLIALYSDSIQEYDDFTAILVTFDHEQLTVQRKRILAQKELEQAETVKRLQQQMIAMEKEKAAKKQESENASSTGGENSTKDVAAADTDAMELEKEQKEAEKEKKEETRNSSSAEQGEGHVPPRQEKDEYETETDVSSVDPSLAPSPVPASPVRV